MTEEARIASLATGPIIIQAASEAADRVRAGNLVRIVIDNDELMPTRIDSMGVPRYIWQEGTKEE